MRRIRAIRQRQSNDCGCSVIAMVARVPYQIAFRAIYGKNKSYGTHLWHLKKALKVFGIGFEEKLGLSRDWEQVPTYSIVSINFRVGAWHWVVFTENQFGEKYWGSNACMCV